MRFLKITCEIKDAKPVKTNCNTVWLDIPKEVKAIENDERELLAPKEASFQY